MVTIMLLEPVVVEATFTWGNDQWVDTFVVQDLLQVQLFADWFGGSLDYYQVIDMAYADASHDLWFV